MVRAGEAVREMMGVVVDVEVRLHVDPEMDAEPLAVITLPSPLPVEIVRVDELTGIEVVYALRRRHLPSAYSNTQATADYLWKELR